MPRRYNLAAALLRPPSRRRRRRPSPRVPAAHLDLRRGGGRDRAGRARAGAAGRTGRGPRAHRVARFGRVRRRRSSARSPWAPSRCRATPSSGRPTSPTSWPRAARRCWSRPPRCATSLAAASSRRRRGCGPSSSPTRPRTPADAGLAAWVDTAPDAFDAADTHRDAPPSGCGPRAAPGAPKAAVHLHQDWPWCCEGFGVGVLALTRADRIFSAAKLFHAYGLGNSLAFPFWVGAPAVLCRAGDARRRVRHPRPPWRRRCSSACRRSTRRCCSGPRTTPPSGPGALRLAVSAGEPLPPDLYRRWRERFAVELLDAPGIDRGAALLSVAAPGPRHAGQRRRAGTGLRDAHRGRTGPRGARRRRGRAVGARPQHRDRLLAAARADHRQDARAVVRVGRSLSARRRGPLLAHRPRRRHVQGGRRVVLGHRGGGGAGRPRRRGRMRGRARARCRRRAQAARRGGAGRGASTTARPSPTRCGSFVRERLAHYKCPRTIDFVAELPKTATGKIQRFKLRV